VHLGSADAEAPVDGLETERMYECTCGAEFDHHLEDAKNHLKAVAGSPNGEAITPVASAESRTLSIEHASTDDGRSGAKLTWEVPPELATRIWIEAERSDAPCSSQLAWAANWGLKRALRNNESVASFDFYTAARGWQSHLISIFDGALGYTEGPHEAELAAVKSEIEAL
jgi:hypothetical protein